MLLGYVSRCCSDSDDTSDEDYPVEQPASRRRSAAGGKERDREAWRREGEHARGESRGREREREKEGQQEVKIIVTADVGNEGGDEEEEDEEKGATGSQANPDQEVKLEIGRASCRERV